MLRGDTQTGLFSSCDAVRSRGTELRRLETLCLLQVVVPFPRQRKKGFLGRHPELRIMAFPRARAMCSASLALQLLACAGAQTPAVHPHRGPAVTPAGTSSAAQVGAVETLQHGLFRAHYELPLRPMRPGEVAITSPATTLLAHPAGRVAIVDWSFDLVYENGSSVPLNALYNHHVRLSFRRIMHRTLYSRS